MGKKVFSKKEKAGLTLGSSGMVLLAGLLTGPLGALVVSGFAVGTVGKIRRKRVGHSDSKSKLAEAYSLATNVAGIAGAGKITTGDVVTSTFSEGYSTLIAKGEKKRK